jgi:hypothetical protein
LILRSDDRPIKRRQRRACLPSLQWAEGGFSAASFRTIRIMRRPLETQSSSTVAALGVAFAVLRGEAKRGHVASGADNGGRTENAAGREYPEFFMEPYSRERGTVSAMARGRVTYPGWEE